MWVWYFVFFFVRRYFAATVCASWCSLPKNTAVVTNVRPCKWLEIELVENWRTLVTVCPHMYVCWSACEYTALYTPCRDYLFNSIVIINYYWVLMFFWWAQDRRRIFFQPQKRNKIGWTIACSMQKACTHMDTHLFGQYKFKSHLLPTRDEHWRESMLQLFYATYHIYFGQRYLLTPCNKKCHPPHRTLHFMCWYMRHALREGLNAHEFLIHDQSNRKFTMVRFWHRNAPDAAYLTFQWKLQYLLECSNSLSAECTLAHADVCIRVNIYLQHSSIVSVIKPAHVLFGHQCA